MKRKELVRRVRRTISSDRGEALAFAIVAPILLASVFGILQGASWYHARNVAIAAAQQGAYAASGQYATQGSGQQAATKFIDQAGGNTVIVASSVTVDRTATTVTVTVTGSGVSFVPGLSGVAVTQSASLPVERFTTRTDR